MVAAAPGRQDPLPVNNPLQGRQGHQQGTPGHRRDSSPPRETPGLPQVNNLLQGRQGHQQGIPGLLQASNPLPGRPGPLLVSSPRNRIVPPIIIPGRVRRVQVMLPRTIIPGARGKQGHSNTNSPDRSIRAGLRNLPVRHRRPGQVEAAPLEVQEEDRYIKIV